MIEANLPIWNVEDITHFWYYQGRKAERVSLNTKQMRYEFMIWIRLVYRSGFDTVVVYEAQLPWDPTPDEVNLFSTIRTHIHPNLNFDFSQFIRMSNIFLLIKYWISLLNFVYTWNLTRSYHLLVIPFPPVLFHKRKLVMLVLSCVWGRNKERLSVPLV